MAHFNWADEFKDPDRTVYKLVIVNNVDIIQGLVSLTPTSDNVFMHLIESAPFNFGKSKMYEGSGQSRSICLQTIIPSWN